MSLLLWLSELVAISKSRPILQILLSLAPASAPPPMLIVFSGARATEVASTIGKAGGSNLWSRAGLATVTSDASDFADRVRGSAGVKSVVRDMNVAGWDRTSAAG